MKPSKPLEPWAQRPFPAKGDDTREPIFAAIGLALTQWNQFETTLAALFSHMIALDRSSQAALRAFGAVRTFEGRLSMVKAAAEVYFATVDSNFQKDFQKLAGREWREYSSRRNEIAHGIVSPFHPVWDKRGGEGEVVGYTLAPPSYDYQKSALNSFPEYAYDSVAILHYAEQFKTLSNAPEMMALLIVVRGKS